MKAKKYAEQNPKDNPANDPINDYETQDHLQTIIKAHGIMMDPDKMKKVHKLAGRHKKAISSIKDVKNVLQEKYGSKAKASDSDEDDL